MTRRTVNGHVVRLDDEDAGLFDRHRWYTFTASSGCTYVNTVIDGHTVYLHRLITAAPIAFDVDHINHDGLDNRRSNLRVAPHALNLANQRPQAGRSSRFKGVSFSRRSRRWEAYIKVDQRKVNLGYFTSEQAAADAYDQAALNAWGDFALTNRKVFS